MKTFSLPIWGSEWIDDPVYFINKHPLWRLSSMKSKYFLHEEVSPAFAGLLRENRSGLMRFNADHSGFIGPREGGALLAWSEKGQNILSSSGDNFPVVSFYAPFEGRYEISVYAARARFSGSTSRLGLNIAEYHGTKRASASLLYIERTPDQNNEVKEEVTVELSAGEEVGFIADANTNGEADNSAWENFQASIGYLGRAKGQQ